MSHLIGFLQYVMGVSGPDAEELASDVLLRVSFKIQSFKYGGRAKLTTWIFEIAKNRAIDFHRKQKLRPEEIPLSTSLTDGSTESLGDGHSQKVKAWLDEQLKSMPDQDRLLLLWRANEFPHSQIAVWLGITEGASRTRHARLQAKLISESKRAITRGAVSP